MASRGFGKAGQYIKIDWEEFDKLVSYQCTQAEIAAFFDCSVDTLERAVFRDRGVTLADLWNKRKFLGKVRLRKAQFQIVESMGAGAATMAIWLDKKINPEENPERPQPPTPPPTPFEQSLQVTFSQFCVNGTPNLQTPPSQAPRRRVTRNRNR